MKKLLPGLGLGLCLHLLAITSWALVNNSNYLILYPGDTFEASGVLYRNISITVFPGAGISLPQNQSTDTTKWSLQLVAPYFYLGGTITAEGVSYSTSGLGSAGSNTYTGSGGSGYGGVGGVGENNPGSGGPTYDNYYREQPGSRGGYYAGGGSIRIDAMSLVVASTGLINARGAQYASYTTGGGASGGCILLNGLLTYLYAGYDFEADGGPGQLQGQYWTWRIDPLTRLRSKYLASSSGGGGGGGGRIKLYRYPYNQNNLFHDYMGTFSVTGGPGGGGQPLAAAGGQTGACGYFTGYMPSTPTLLAPDDGQQVGLTPTLNFIASDIQSSQFFHYEIQFSTDSFASVSWTASQMAADAGWQGQPFFKSNQMASYALPADLNVGTTYSWRVRVTNTNGLGTNGWTTYSAARSFTTVNKARPYTPVLLYPAWGQNNINKTPALRIFGSDPDPLGDTLTFSITLSQDPGLSNPKIIQASYAGWNASGYPAGPAGVTATCQILNTPANSDALEPGATYYWKTVCYDTFMMTSTSAMGAFFVVPFPPPPALISPADQDTVTTSLPVLQMVSNSPTNFPLRYQYKLELSSDDFQTVTTYLSQNGNGWTQNQYASGAPAALQLPSASALVSGQTYSWRVAAYDVDNDNWSVPSETRAFSVVTPPLVPQLLSPDNNYVGPNSAIAFQFQAVSEAGNTLTYRFDLSSNNFQSVLQTFDQRTPNTGWASPVCQPGETANFTLPASLPLARGADYQWRVAAWDGFSWSQPSETRAFSLAASLALPVSKIFPNPAVSRQNLHVVLQPTVDAEATLHLFNAQAKEIRRVTWNLQGGRSNDYLLDISTCAPGAYFTITEINSPFGNKKWVSRFAVVN